MCDPWQQSYGAPHIEFCAVEICPVEHSKQNYHDDESDETYNTDEHIDITINKGVFSRMFALECYEDIARYI